MEDAERCDAELEFDDERSFYCVLAIGHAGPHRESGEARRRVSYTICWGKGDYDEEETPLATA